jgi:hypothetical protein
MIRAVAIRILRQVLLVVVGEEAIFHAETARLRRRGRVDGRLSVDVDVDLPVDHDAIPWKQCPRLNLGYIRD